MEEEDHGLSTCVPDLVCCWCMDSKRCGNKAFFLESLFSRVCLFVSPNNIMTVYLLVCTGVSRKIF